MPRHDSLDVEGEDTVQARDPAVKIAIAEPGEATHEQEIAQKGHLLPRDMQDQVAVAVRRSPILGVQCAFQTVDHHLVVEGFRRPDQFDLAVFRAADALEKPLLQGIAWRHQFLHIRAEQQPQLLARIGHEPSIILGGAEVSVERLPRLVVRRDRNISEGDIARGVIEMKMRVDQLRRHASGFRFDRAAET